MKQKKLWIIVGIGLILLIVSYIAFETAHTGEAAFKRMSATEQRIATKLKTLSASSSLDDLVAILGQPERSGAGLRPTWCGPSGGGHDQIAVYLNPRSATIRKIRWMKICSFFWEHVPQ